MQDNTKPIDPILVNTREELEDLIRAPDGWIAIPNKISSQHARVKLADLPEMPPALRDKVVWAFSDWLPKYVEEPGVSWILQTDLPRLPPFLIDTETANRVKAVDCEIVWDHKHGIMAFHIRRDASTQHCTYVNTLPCSKCKKVDPNAQVCARCKVSRYCNEQCQKLDYIRHRGFCLMLADQKQCVPDAVETPYFVSNQPCLPVEKEPIAPGAPEPDGMEVTK